MKNKRNKEWDVSVQQLSGPPPIFTPESEREGVFQTHFRTARPALQMKNEILECDRDGKTPLLEFQTEDGKIERAPIVGVATEDDDVIHLYVRL